MAIKKKGRFFHYEFMIDGRKYRGSTKDTVKSRAQSVEALLIAEVRNSGGNVNLRKAPVLREFAVRFLDFVEAQRISGHLSLSTKRYYFSGWELLERTALANMRVDRIGTGDAAVLSFPGGRQMRTRPSELSAGGSIGQLIGGISVQLRELSC